MRKLNALFIFATFFLTSSFLSISEGNKKVTTGQSEIDTLNWIGLLETQTECEIFYSLSECGTDRKLLLKYLNEVPLKQNIKFKVNVRYLGYFISEEKTISIAPNQTITGSCDSTDSNLFIKLLPPNWDFANTTVSAQLIEVIN